MIKQIGTLNIEIERRKIKNINIYVKPPNGDVLVTVPMRVSDEEVFRFLKKKEEWILKNHEKVKNRQNSSQQEITHPFLKEKMAWGLAPYVQALLLARYLRGDMDEYPPFLWK